jgi:hypothetical protein
VRAFWFFHSREDYGLIKMANTKAMQKNGQEKLA